MIINDTETGLLRSILEQPDEDTVRLAYADYLDENSGTRPCVKCQGTRIYEWEDETDWGTPIPRKDPCWYCKETGVELDSGAARAEYIRLSCAGVNEQRRRDLLGKYGAEWSSSLASVLGLKKWGNSGVTGGPGTKHSAWGWNRGFISHLELYTDSFLRAAPELFRLHPITSVDLRDKSATEESEGFVWYYGRRWNIQTEWPFTFGMEVEKKFGWTNASTPASYYRSVLYKTQREAQILLSKAAVQYGRLAAGLLPLTTK